MNIPKKEKTYPLVVYITPSMNEYLRKLSSETGRSISEIIRFLIEENRKK